MALIGFVELFGAITLWFPDYVGMAGAFTLFATSAGAICFHLYFDTWKDAIPAFVTISLSSILFYIQFSALGI